MPNNLVSEKECCILYSKKYMKTIYAGLLFFFLLSLSVRSQNDTIKIYYYENYPYAYTEKTSDNPKIGIVRGIEIEIIEEYAKWLKKKRILM